MENTYDDKPLWQRVYKKSVDVLSKWIFLPAYFIISCAIGAGIIYEVLQKETNLTRNLMRCAVKKTISMLDRHVLYASYMIVAASVLCVLFLGSIWIFIPMAYQLITSLQPVMTNIINGLCAVPWYVYVIIAIPAMYFGYSLVWCIARELTDKDWGSNEAYLVEVVIILSTIIIAYIIFAIHFTTSPIHFTTSPNDITSAIFIITVIVVASGFFITILTKDKCLLFIGAYTHYRRRMKL